MNPTRYNFADHHGTTGDLLFTYPLRGQSIQQHTQVVCVCVCVHAVGMRRSVTSVVRTRCTTFPSSGTSSACWWWWACSLWALCCQSTSLEICWVSECVCVCKREKETERERKNMPTQWRISVCV